MQCNKTDSMLLNQNVTLTAFSTSEKQELNDIQKKILNFQQQSEINN